MRIRFELARLRALTFGILACGVLLACGFHSENEAVQRLRARIQHDIGSDSSVNVRSAYGATTVTIRLMQLPAADSVQVQAQVEALAKAEFPQTEYVVVLTKP